MQSKDTSAPVLGDEPDASRSLAATLRLAAARGYIEKEGERKAAKKPKPQARIRTEKDYKPEINLEYTDDFGRKLETPKEAFRYLCHKFHGKGPGKNKIDKRLRKQQLESRVKESLSVDAPMTSVSMLIDKQKELKSPFIVLSKGK